MSDHPDAAPSSSESTESAVIPPRRFKRPRWREWRQRLAFWVGALLVGGSVGREGPTLHVGAAVIDKVAPTKP